MDLPPLPLIDGCLFIDNSGWIEGMSTCTRYLQYKSLNLRVGAGEKPALNFGSAIHLGTELRYTRYPNKCVDDKYYEDLATLFTEFFMDHEVPAGDWRDLNWATTVMHKYNERYDIEEFSLLKYDTPVDCFQCKGSGFFYPQGAGKPVKSCLFCDGTGKRDYMVEMPFVIPLYVHRSLRHQIPIMYTGRIDLPISYQGDIYVNDFKTSGQLGDMFWNEHRMSAQQKGYCYAFNKLTGINVKGYQISAIRTKQPPQYVTNGTISNKGKSQSPAQWWQESLNRERFPLKPTDLDEWLDNTIELVEEFFYHYERGIMPMKTKWCASYGKCPYFDVCSLVPQDRLAFLNSGLFTKNVWSPLHQPTMAMQ